MKNSRYFLIIFTLFSLLILIPLFSSNNEADRSNTSQKAAAIIDQLETFHPNKRFVNKITQILIETGFEVQYFSGEKVNVNFYRNFPAGDYKLMIFRVHSAIIEGTHDVCLFTSEPYEYDKACSAYLDEILNEELVRVYFTMGGPEYFGITPNFVKHEMPDFHDSIIIMMGCDTLRPGYTSLAECFLEKGAKVFIGWSGPVTLKHSDEATLVLLKLILAGYDVKNAIIQTMNKVGPDPLFKSELLYYSVNH
ncbi:MAG: hypothetical protein ACTSYM_01840 [Candidatus Baldrarchaeia archaeon]